MAVLNLYLDESGARHPDLQPLEGWSANCHWFGLGGVLIDEDDEASARAAIESFRAGWPQIGDAPLHSYEIRNKRENFHWLSQLTKSECERFWGGVGELLESLPIIGVGCVVDAPGYNIRYKDQYADQRWMLCKTAFAIAIERCVKHALDVGARLRVFVERTDAATEQVLRGYYEAIRRDGHPFEPSRAEIYAPTTPEQFRAVLLEFRPKYKTSPLMQVGDLVLWPICKGGYDPTYRPYVGLYTRGLLLDCVYPTAVDERGIKYSCFEHWRDAQKSKTPR